MTNRKERKIHQDKPSLEEERETVGVRSDRLVGVTYVDQKDKKVIEGKTKCRWCQVIELLGRVTLISRWNI